MNNLSYYKNTEQHEFIYQTIGSRMRQWSETQPDKAAIIVHMNHETRAVMTFGELYKKAVKLARYYISVGVRPGDRVAVFVYNSPEWLVATVACSLAGAVLVNSSSFASEAGLDVARNTGCKVLVGDLREESVKTLLLENIRRFKHEGFSAHVILVDTQNTVCHEHTVTFDRVLSLDIPDTVALPNYIDAEDYTCVFQTSGSTGVPKLVPYTHIQLLNNPIALYKAMGLTSEDIYFSDRPMGYMAGFPLSLMVLGCTVVTLNSQSTVRDCLVANVCKILKEERVTSAFLPAYIVYDMEKYKRNSDQPLPHFKSVIITGQRLSKTLLQQFKEYAGKPCIGFGTTECGWCTFSSLEDLPDIEDDGIGRPLPEREMKIVDESGHVVPVNTIGDICVRDVCLVGKYLKLSGEMVSYLDDKGWFHTGDKGYMMSDMKNFCVKGRSVEIIKRSTIKIFPSSVERVIAKHPKIAGVVVVGIPDERQYQEVCACVTVKIGHKLGTEELEEFSLKHFRPEATPDGKGLMPGHFFIFDAFPTLPSQKVDRIKVAQIATSRALQTNKME